jgi:hypothetical protein
MATNSVVGSVFRAFFRGIEADAIEMWFAAAPIVAICTPLGAYLCPLFKLGSKRLIFYTVITVQAFVVTGLITITKLTFSFVSITILVVWTAVSGVISLGGTIRVSSNKE